MRIGGSSSGSPPRAAGAMSRRRPRAGRSRAPSSARSTHAGPIPVPGGGAVARAARVRAKPRASVTLVIPEVGPLLAEAPAGAGHAIAYASDDVAPNTALVRAALRRALRPPRAPGYAITLAA